jgi:hypothetical protein
MHHPNVLEIFVILTLILIIREVRVVWNIVGGSYMGRWCKRMPVPVNRVARLGSAAMDESLEAVAVARPRVHIHDVQAVTDREGDWLDLGSVQRRHDGEALTGSVTVADATLGVKGQDAPLVPLPRGMKSMLSVTGSSSDSGPGLQKVMAAVGRRKSSIVDASPADLDWKKVDGSMR